MHRVIASSGCRRQAADVKETGEDAIILRLARRQAILVRADANSGSLRNSNLARARSQLLRRVTDGWQSMSNCQIFLLPLSLPTHHQRSPMS